MSALVRSLAGYCRDHPLDEKVFVVPSFVAGRRIGEALAREAGSWVNLRFVTIPALAAEVLERRGETGRPGLMTASAEMALTDRLFRQMLAEGKAAYFEKAGASPGLSRALHRAVQDLRLDGRTGADLTPGLFLAPDKGRALALLLTRYERALLEEGRLDLAGFLDRAAAAARRGPLGALFLCPADTRLRRLEAEFLAAASGGRLLTVPGDPVNGLERPRQCLASADPPGSADANPLSFLFAPADVPPEAKAARIDIFRALGPANECREIVRRLYAERIPFDQAEVLVPRGTAHATVFYLLAARTGLPVTFGDGVAVSFTSPGRLFFGLIDWLRDDYSSDDLCRLLENGDLSLPGRPGEGPLAPRAACRHLRNALIGWGRGRYIERLAALRESKLADIAALDRPSEGRDGEETAAERAIAREAVAEIEALSSAIERVLEMIPEPEADGSCDLAGPSPRCSRHSAAPSPTSIAGPAGPCSTGWASWRPSPGSRPCG